MRRLTSFTFQSIDGFFKGPDEDISWNRHGPEEIAFSEAQLTRGDTLVFGRRTYEHMMAFWPTPCRRRASAGYRRGHEPGRQDRGVEQPARATVGTCAHRRRRYRRSAPVAQGCERQVAAFVEHYNHARSHESLGNLTPADVYLGRGQAILTERERIKRYTIQHRRLQHRLQVA